MSTLEALESFIVAANSVFWGVPLFILILGVGLLLTARLGAIQVRLFPLAVRNCSAPRARRPRAGKATSRRSRP